jgi:propanol-preferring alcohol dehydrogenase
LATASTGSSSQLVEGLTDGGRLVVLGVSPEPLQVATYPLISGGYSVHGSLTGSAIENKDSLALAVAAWHRSSDPRC